MPFCFHSHGQGFPRDSLQPSFETAALGARGSRAISAPCGRIDRDAGPIFVLALVAARSGLFVS